jgi:hypothetical protein
MLHLPAVGCVIGLVRLDTTRRDGSPVPTIGGRRRWIEFDDYCRGGRNMASYPETAWRATCCGPGAAASSADAFMRPPGSSWAKGSKRL